MLFNKNNTEFAIGSPFPSLPKGRIKKSMKNNNAHYIHYVSDLMEICLGQFNYNDYPNSMDMFYFEYWLMLNGSVLVFRDEVLNEILCLPWQPEGTFNVYFKPTRLVAHSLDYYYDKLTPYNSVIVYNTKSRKDSYSDILYFAERLWKLDQTFDINVISLRTPVIVKGDEKLKFSLLNMLSQFMGGVPYIGVKSGLTDSIEVLDLKAEAHLNEILEAKRQLYNDALSSIGVRSIPEKTAHMTNQEIDVLVQDSKGVYRSKKEARLVGLNAVNAMFGTDIKLR